MKLLPVCLIAILFSILGTSIVTLASSTGECENLTLTLDTDGEYYLKGEQIHISGTVHGDNGTPLTCTGTLLLSCYEWERKIPIQINDGIYSYEYTISFGDPSGTWNLTIQVGENGTSKSIDVGLPADTVYYKVEISGPPMRHSYRRGARVLISVNVTEAGEPVENAIVSCRSISGDNLPPLTENSPGWYYMDYILGWDEPLGKWSISVEAKKIADNKLKAGGSYTTVTIEPAVIGVEVLCPTTFNFRKGDTVDIEVKISYPNGTIPEKATVTATLPDGENMELTSGENGIYAGSYSITSENLGGWTMMLTATDPYGNSGTSSIVISISPPQRSFSLFLILSIAAVPFAASTTTSYIILRKRRARRLRTIREEKEEIRKAQTDVAVQYFKKGEISREAYDKLMHKLERKITELEKEETILKGKKKI